MTTLETLKWDGKKSGKVSLDLAVAKETSSADLIHRACLLYTSPSPRDRTRPRMPSSA